MSQAPLETNTDPSIYTFVACSTLSCWWQSTHGNYVGSNPHQPMPEDDKGDVVLLLNWITFCLVQDPTEQSIASALHLDTPMTMTFLLASKLSPSPEQLAYADRLFSSLQFIVSRQVAREMDGLAPLSQEEDTREFLGVVARDAYKRAHRKATKLNDLGPRYKLGSTQALIRKLLGNGGVFQEYTLVDNAYTGILTQTPLLLSPKVKTRVAALLAITQHAQAILKSNFINQIRRSESKLHPYTSDSDTSFRFHFHRLLQRLFFYRFGASRVFGKGGKSLRRLSTAGWTIKHEWIPTPRPFLFRFPQDSTAMLRHVLLKQYDCAVSVEDIRHALSVAHKSDTDEVWREGDERVFHIHPEVQIITYLDDKQIVARKRAIGISRRPCRWFNSLAFDGPAGTRWKVTRPTYKYSPDWMYPNDPQRMATAVLYRNDCLLKSIGLVPRDLPTDTES